MPAEPVTVTATWITDPTAPITMTVNSAGIDTEVAPSGAVGITASGLRIPGRTVTVNAGTCQNHIFGGWTASDPSVTFANPDSPETTIEVPAANVTLTATWLPTYTVTVNGGGSTGSGREPGKSGFADRYLVGETVVIFSGTFSGRFFGSWNVTGGASLANANAMTTTFTMPANNVNATAVWATGGTAARTAPLMSSMAVTGFRTYRLNAHWVGTSGSTGNGSSAASVDHTMTATDTRYFVQSDGGNGNFNNRTSAFIRVQTAGGNITIEGRHRPASGHSSTAIHSLYEAIAYNAANDQSRLLINAARTQYGVYWGEASGIPSGWSDYVLVRPVTVNNSHAAGAASGAGNYQPGSTISLNAGTHPDRTMMFAGWIVNAGGVDLDDETAAVTYFTMPNTPVTVTADWRVNPDFLPNVYWPKDLTASYGTNLADVPLPGNVADADSTLGPATPGHFEWHAPGNSVGTVTGSPHNHYLEFVPDLSVRDIFDQYYHHPIPVAVTPAVPVALTLPDALIIGEGDPLSGYALTGGSTGIIPGASTAAGGTWAWADPEAVPNATGPQPVTFTPNAYSLANYGWAQVPNGTWNGTAVTGLAVNVTVSQRNTVTVNASEAGNSGAGNYLPEELVTIRAGEKDGISFDGWTVDSGNVTLADNNSATTAFTMPGTPVEVTAKWVPTYRVAIVSEGNNISGDGYYRENALVTAHPGTLNGFDFTGWEVTSGGPLTITGNTFNMPTRDVTLTATWRLSPVLSDFTRGIGFVQLHTGNGWYPEFGYGPHNSGFLNINLAVPGTHTLTLPDYNGGNGNLHLGQGVHIIRPDDVAGLLSVTVSIEVNGEIKIADRPMVEGSFTNWTAATRFSGVAQNGGPSMSGFALPGNSGGSTAVINSDTPSLKNNNPPMTVHSYMIDGANGAPGDQTLAATPDSDAAAITPLNGGAKVRIIFEVFKPCGSCNSCDCNFCNSPCDTEDLDCGDPCEVCNKVYECNNCCDCRPCLECGCTVCFVNGICGICCKPTCDPCGLCGCATCGPCYNCCVCIPCNLCGCLACRDGGRCKSPLCLVCLGAGEAFGDIDGDGNINSADVTLLRRYIAAEDKPLVTGIKLTNAKVTPGTGDVSAADITMLRRWIASPDKFPLGK
jgi:uncharacterized repeat protein (TIGR02543 family)